MTDIELEQRWSDWLLERNRQAIKNVLFIVIALYPLFGVLDYFVAPDEWLWLLYSTRVAISIVTLAMFHFVRSAAFARHHYVVSASYMVLIGFGISLMTVFMGGLASPYYAGLSLTILGTGLLFVWPARVVLATHAAIIASFVVPNSLLGQTEPALDSISNLFFLVSTAIIAGTGQIFAYRSQRAQVASKLVIESTKRNLEFAHAQLKELDRFKSEFFANITHELKTPLTLILASLELLIEGDLGKISSVQRSTCAGMQKSGVKLLRLIGDLLDLSKLEESKLRLRIDEHDLVSYLNGLLAQSEPLAQRKNIDLRFSSSAERCSVWCDLERIERVFINLLSNAYKFTAPGGSVSVELTDEADSVVVCVKDTGSGFPCELSEKIFERFFQIDMADTRKFGGAGIGLALARELVKLHGGAIWANGELGKGATFSVRLPKDREHFEPQVLDRRASQSERPHGSRAGDRGLGEWRVNAEQRFRLIEIEQATEQRVVERDYDEQERPHSVLVIDDTPDVIRVIHLALRQHFRVFTASEGSKGFELAVERRPTLIITDQMMPEVSGIELTHRLRRDPRTKHIPVIMLTALGGVDDRVAGLEAGVNAYLTKPFSGKELLSTVRSLLTSQDATADLILAQRIDSLEAIAGGLAHEIRNPLNYLTQALANIERDTEGLLSIIQASSPTDPVRAKASISADRMGKMFKAANAGVRRISGTVDLMIRYSREGYTRVPKPYDLFAATRDVVQLVRSATNSSARVELDLDGEAWIECVPEELNQVLTNLVQNALEAVPAQGGMVCIHGAADDEQIVLAFRDNGIGIKPDDQAKIFTPFFSTKDVGHGLGMGLTISRRCVAALGGTIAVTSEPGRGSEFIVRLPRKAAERNVEIDSQDPTTALWAGSQVAPSAHHAKMPEQLS